MIRGASHHDRASGDALQRKPLWALRRARIMAA
jgi:hypothetical protein